MPKHADINTYLTSLTSYLLQAHQWMYLSQDMTHLIVAQTDGCPVSASTNSADYLTLSTVKSKYHIQEVRLQLKMITNF